MTQKLWLTLCFVLLPSLAQAQTKWDVYRIPGLKHSQKCHPGDVTRCVIYLRKGEKSPFDGALQTPKQAAIVSVRADPKKVQERIDEAVKQQKDLGENDLKLEKKYRAIDAKAAADTLAATITNYDERIERLEDALPSWYQEPWFVATVSVALTIGAVAGTVAIACELSGCD